MCQNIRAKFTGLVRDSSARDVRPPPAGVEWAIGRIGRCRRPRRRSPARLAGTTPHRRLAAPCWAYARRSRHPLTHLYAKRSLQIGSWAGGSGWTQGGLVTSLRRPGRCAVRRPVGGRTGWIEARTGMYRPTCAREKEREG